MPRNRLEDRNAQIQTLKFEGETLTCDISIPAEIWEI
jgi:hypothetical protein